MNRSGRLLLAPGLFVVSLAVLWIESTGVAIPLKREYRLWLGANALKAPPLQATFVPIGNSDETVTALDAALVLRAVERFNPQSVVFLNPIAADTNRPLLESKLRDARFPVIFSATSGLIPLANVSASDRVTEVVAGSWSAPGTASAGAWINQPAVGTAQLAVRLGTSVAPSAAFLAALTRADVAPPAVTGTIPGSLQAASRVYPVRADGSALVNPAAERLIETMPFDELMVQIERSEQGRISPGLQDQFSDRVVAVGSVAAGIAGAVALAAIENGLLEKLAPWWVAPLFALVAASLPWWGRKRFDRFVWAVIAGTVWILLALAFYQEFRVVLPLSLSLILPLFAAGIAFFKRA